MPDRKLWSRPFALALAIFIALNLYLAFQGPALSATRVWLYLRIEEPRLSAVAALLGAAFFVPHAAARWVCVRWILGGIFSAFLVLVGINVASYYVALWRGQLGTLLPMPLSALNALILLAEIWRVARWKPWAPLLPAPAARFVSICLVPVAFLLFLLAHIITFGVTDYSPLVEKADAVVVLGARVYADGRLSHALEDRMAVGVELMKRGKARLLVLSGGIEAGGISEPQAMARSAQDGGVSSENILIDEGGQDTYRSALNCAALVRQQHLTSLLVVSQYYHNARVKLIFERVCGVPCYTVPARHRFLDREIAFVFREVIAFPYYMLVYQ